MPEPVSLHATGASGRREWRLIGYASGNFGKNLVWSTADITLLFILTDLVGMPVASAALLMTIAVVGDLIFDLVAGAISAQVKAHGAGYRWLITYAAIPCGIAFMLLYALPWWGEHRFWTIAAVVLVFRVAFAVVDVPHFAMMASMASDSRARGRTAGYRSFFSTISSLIIATFVVPFAEKSTSSGDAAPLAAFGSCAALIFSVVMAISAHAGNLPPAGRSSRKAISLRLSIPKLAPCFWRCSSLRW